MALEVYVKREKGRDLTQSYDKKPLYHKKLKAKKRHKDATKIFDNTTVTIAERLRTAS